MNGYKIGSFEKVAKMGGKVTVVLMDDGTEVACYFKDCVLPTRTKAGKKGKRPRRLEPNELIAYVPQVHEGQIRAEAWFPVKNWS